MKKNKLRMTTEELNKLKPSYDNQIELVCDNGRFKNSTTKKLELFHQLLTISLYF